MYNVYDLIWFIEALPTVNFKDLEEGGQELVDFIHGLSEDFPIFVTEYWTGWFDEWGRKHSTDMQSTSEYIKLTEAKPCTCISSFLATVLNLKSF